ncbi:hypothetical protein, partial [Mesorhizobium sp. M3A.F.Ca.ET.174.01.1.1]|uniref:hypothetical protein n=1 Tax=Mesorhizobium sp. M3A.F.Ca.ET.174.01.1.1 TaxID=2563944 RepID=UPI001AEE7D32
AIRSANRVAVFSISGSSWVVLHGQASPESQGYPQPGAVVVQAGNAAGRPSRFRCRESSERFDCTARRPLRDRVH